MSFGEPGDFPWICWNSRQAVAWSGHAQFLFEGPFSGPGRPFSASRDHDSGRVFGHAFGHAFGHVFGRVRGQAASAGPGGGGRARPVAESRGLDRAGTGRPGPHRSGRAGTARRGVSGEVFRPLERHQTPVFRPGDFLGNPGLWRKGRLGRKHPQARPRMVRGAGPAER